MISAIILSAGESQRFGSPKALAILNGQTAIKTIQQSLLDCSSINEIIVVLGAHADKIEPHVFNHTKVRLVHNKDYKLGQTSSFQCGVSSVGGSCRGFMLFPVDCPLIKIQTIEELCCRFNEQNPTVLIPTFNAQRGHPPVFNATLKNEIMKLSPDKGINSIFMTCPITTVSVDDPGILKTFNTTDELIQIQDKNKNRHL